MTPAKLLLVQAVDDGVMPGGVLLGWRRGSLPSVVAAGCANLVDGRKMTPDTVFDLASLTKPLATVPAIMTLIAQQAIELEQPIGTLLPLIRAPEKQRITIRQLLCHMAGLPSHRPFYKKLRTLEAGKRKPALRRLIVEEPLAYTPGSRSVYSDIDFMMLEWIVERVSGMRLDRFVTEKIYRPLGLDDLFFVDLGKPRPSGRRFAATERCPWRKRILDGEVHDDNAHVVGGIAGHAGLFGTAADIRTMLGRLLDAWQGGGHMFDTGLVRTFFQRQPGTDWALGFDTPSQTGSSAGRLFSRRSVGHLGFTGASFWMDLERSIIIILLTNRVHPTRENIRIRSFRPLIHEAAIKCLMD